MTAPSSSGDQRSGFAGVGGSSPVSALQLASASWSDGPKSKSSAGRRTLKLTGEARSIFARRAAASATAEWLFEGKKNGTHLTDVQNAHCKVLAETKLAFVVYDFRHTAATRWAERGMDIATLAKVLGHANLRSVMRYVHISQEHMDRAILRYGEPSEATQEEPKAAKAGFVQ